MRSDLGHNPLNWWLTETTYVDETAGDGPYTYEVIAWNETEKRPLRSMLVSYPPLPREQTRISVTKKGSSLQLDWPDYTGEGELTNYRVFRSDLTRAPLHWWLKYSEYEDETAVEARVTYRVVAWNETDQIPLQTYWVEVANGEATREVGQISQMRRLRRRDNLRSSVSVKTSNSTGPSIPAEI